MKLRKIVARLGIVLALAGALIGLNMGTANALTADGIFEVKMTCHYDEEVFGNNGWFNLTGTYIVAVPFAWSHDYSTAWIYWGYQWPGHGTGDGATGIWAENNTNVALDNVGIYGRWDNADGSTHANLWYFHGGRPAVQHSGWHQIMSYEDARTVLSQNPPNDVNRQLYLGEDGVGYLVQPYFKSDTQGGNNEDCRLLVHANSFPTD